MNYNKIIKAGKVDWNYIHSFLGLICDKKKTNNKKVFYYIGDTGVIRIRTDEQDISIKDVDKDITDSLEQIVGVKV